jgi:hypothetical protein
LLGQGIGAAATYRQHAQIDVELLAHRNAGASGPGMVQLSHGYFYARAVCCGEGSKAAMGSQKMNGRQMFDIQTVDLCPRLRTISAQASPGLTIHLADARPFEPGDR